MSTHCTRLWIDVEDRHGDRGTIGVAIDPMVDLCVRVSVSEGDMFGDSAQIHLHPDHAELVAKAILAAAESLRSWGCDQMWKPSVLEIVPSPVSSES